MRTAAHLVDLVGRDEVEWEGRTHWSWYLCVHHTSTHEPFCTCMSGASKAMDRAKVKHMRNAVASVHTTHQIHENVNACFVCGSRFTRASTYLAARPQIWAYSDSKLQCAAQGVCAMACQKSYDLADDVQEMSRARSDATLRPGQAAPATRRAPWAATPASECRRTAPLPACTAHESQRCSHKQSAYFLKGRFVDSMHV